MTRRIATAATLLAIIGCAPAHAASPADTLARDFADPPASARPRAWWHWLNGNVTPAGLDADLRWMHAVGLGGVQAFDVSLGTPQVVARRLPYMSAGWQAAFAQAARTAAGLGLELGIASAPGWSESGGPWVPPSDGMKKLVWSTTDITGGQAVGQLPALPDTTGGYGTAAFVDPLRAFGPGAAPPPRASGDAAVFAYPIGPAPDPAPPRATDQHGALLDARLLTDAREDTAVAIPPGTPDQPAMVTLAWPQPRSWQALTVFVPGAVPPFGSPQLRPVLQADEAGSWTTIATVPLSDVPTTIAFAPVTTARLRLVFAAAPPSAPLLAPPAPGAVVGGVFPLGAAATTIPLAVLRPSQAPLIDRFEAKAGFAAVPDYYALSTTTPDQAGIAPGRVLDLSGRLRADGTLDWTPPAGRWRIVRLGWSLLGTTNHPAAPEATGLEVDKYDAAAVRRYITAYLDRWHAATGPGGRIGALVTDSIEAGNANWTQAMLAQFQRLRGYDPRPYLPALTGQLIGSRAASDSFLYDWRRTLADLLASAHYGTIAAAAHDRGMTLYGEALENGRPQLGDDIAMRAHTDIPMAAMWAFPAGGAPQSTLVGDVLGAASVAHVYGQNLVAAESFTSMFAPWAYAPADLRHIADTEFVLGVNRPVIHTSPASPMDDKLPGLSLAIFGQAFNRRDTWADMARPWIDYLSRCSLLLQQGRHAADLAYFIGEEAPLTALYKDAPLADVPTGRGVDFVDADALIQALRVQDGQIVARGGARYRALYLGGSSRRMTLPVLRAIAALAEAGATILGDAPTGTPSLADDPAAYAALVRQLWPGSARADAGASRVGQGRVIPGHDPDAALAAAGLARDVDAGPDQPAIAFQHRTAPGLDIYFLVNRGTAPIARELSFRVAGRAADVWQADTAQIVPASWQAAAGRTRVPVALAPGGSAFVVFARPSAASGWQAPDVRKRPVAQVGGPWQVGFQPSLGAPAAITLPTLTPLQRAADPALRYFSGVASYTAPFTLSADQAASPGLLVDLGQVGDIAEVWLNGQKVGTAWHAPWRLALGRAARAGTNRLEVKVADLWVNRLIGDAQPGAHPITWTLGPTYRADAPLRPAGLLGPVTIVTQEGTQP